MNGACSVFYCSLQIPILCRTAQNDYPGMMKLRTAGSSDTVSGNDGL